MTDELTKEQYILDPCGTSSTAYWKNYCFQKPDNIQILHENDFSKEKYGYSHIIRYFRLIHHLKVLTPYKLDDKFYFQTVNPLSQIEVIRDIINCCYENTYITIEQIEEWLNYKVYDSELWILVIEKSSAFPIALGIADFDGEIKEGSLEWIQVLPEKRGCGIGKALVMELLSRLQPKANFATVSGQVDNKTNPEKLYRQCGFTGNDIWCVLHNAN